MIKILREYSAHWALWLIVLSVGCSYSEEKPEDQKSTLYQAEGREFVHSKSSDHAPLSDDGVQSYIDTVLKECESLSLYDCAAWRRLFERYSTDLRQPIIGVTKTLDYVRPWVNKGRQLLVSGETAKLLLGVKLITISVQRLKYRILPEEHELKRELSQLAKEERDPIHQAELISLLHLMTPLGEGKYLQAYISLDLSNVVQERAWRILAQRHSVQEPLQLSLIKKTMRVTSSLSVKASVIFAASQLNHSRIIKWCGREWWQSELFKDCKIALSKLDHHRATRALFNWLTTLFEESEHMLNSDDQLAGALVLLGHKKLNQRARRRYLTLLDRFFFRRRTDQAALKVLNSIRYLSPRRFALEVCLRYFRPKNRKVATQSHLFDRTLRQLIHELNE